MNQSIEIEKSLDDHMVNQDKNCAARRWNGAQYLQCGNLGKLEHDGKQWCKIHHPPTVNQKKLDRELKRKAEMDEVERKWAKLYKEQELNRRAAEYLRANCPDVILALMKEVGL